MPDTLCLESPAKVNLRLEVLKKRKDGYHEIRTIFQKISLHDTLCFSLSQKRGIRITTDHPGLPTGKRNLVHRAAVSLMEKAGRPRGVRVDIEKRIPLGAGLGGGSSNAAATLKALNQLLKLNLNEKELMEIGRGIGADVPFFMFEGSAIGAGIGDRLRRIELPSFWYILIYPDFEVSSRWAYQNVILTKSKYDINLRELLKSREAIARLLHNDLEKVVSARYPEIALMKELFAEAGAGGTMMTGSGPTVFGLFPGEEKAKVAFQWLKKKVKGKGWEVIKAHSIP
jgi:4-diphosphocytidyl-2-C-methyl-D-erythritol kinase